MDLCGWFKRFAISKSIDSVGAGTKILVAIILLFIIYVGYRYSQTNNLSEALNIISQPLIDPAVSNCTANINSDIAVLQARLPAEALITIINMTTYNARGAVNTWTEHWFNFQCWSTWPSVVDYFCTDYNQLPSAASNKTAVVVSIVKIDISNTSLAGGRLGVLNPVTEVPLLCDASGALMGYSSGHLLAYTG